MRIAFSNEFSRLFFLLLFCTRVLKFQAQIWAHSTVPKSINVLCFCRNFLPLKFRTLWYNPLITSARVIRYPGSHLANICYKNIIFEHVSLVLSFLSKNPKPSHSILSIPIPTALFSPIFTAIFPATRPPTVNTSFAHGPGTPLTPHGHQHRRVKLTATHLWGESGGRRYA